jgi:hypothetical protein
MIFFLLAAASRSEPESSRGSLMSSVLFALATPLKRRSMPPSRPLKKQVRSGSRNEAATHRQSPRHCRPHSSASATTLLEISL